MFPTKWTAAVTISFLFLFSVAINSDSKNSSYFEVTGPCNFQFPKDHGPHPGYRTEWWYYTGNLASEDGSRFGFQLTFFRSQLKPAGAEKNWPPKRSAWRTNQLFLAHAAVSDIADERFYHAELMAREALNMAGANLQAGTCRVFLKDWTLQITGEEHLLKARTNDFAMRLRLTPEKPPIAHGRDGYSRKGMAPESASCYYSFTRLQAEGTLNIKDRTIHVKGLAWMDHEFSSQPLESDLQGWDWFGLQLSDQSEIMIYLLRKKDGTYSPASSGTFVDAQGTAHHLPAELLQIKALNHWTSPHSQTTYPSKWEIKIEALGMNLIVTPSMADQEMQTPETTQITYWEGSVLVKGASGSHQVTGSGYVELTGYSQAMNERL